MTENNGLPKVSYHTLGCKLNFAETSAIGRALAGAGFAVARDGEEPDLCVVNTCSVTAEAEKKGRQLIRRIASLHPGAEIVVTGCYAQLRPEEVAALPGVVAVLGQNDKLRVAEFVERYRDAGTTQVSVGPREDLGVFVPSCERGERTRFFLKVQDGCDYRCSYCTIPMARGASRSGTVAQMVALARRAEAEGAKEIVLTGVNTGDFGKGTSETFFDLIRALDSCVEGVERFRISSIEPNLLTPEIIEWVATSRAFMPHFHVPLQSGSDAVLRLMRRRYLTPLFRERMELIHKALPDAFVGVDVIAGARGETPDEFRRSMDFIASLPISQLHVFPYSERPGTDALSIGGAVDPAEKHRRVDELIKLGDSKYAAFRASQKGKERPVLWENPPHATTVTQLPEVMHGFTDNYIRVEASFDPRLVNRITSVRLD